MITAEVSDYIGVLVRITLLGYEYSLLVPSHEYNVAQTHDIHWAFKCITITSLEYGSLNLVISSVCWEGSNV